MFLANEVPTLLQRPDQFALLRDDRSLLPRGVDELLRFLPVMNGPVVLLATTAVDVSGTTIQAGEAVLPSIAAANRDGSVFDRSDHLDLGRTHNPHVALGRGAHNCIGAHLARAELEVGLDALFDRFPRLRLAVPEREIPWEDHSPEKSPTHLPVDW